MCLLAVMVPMYDVRVKHILMCCSIVCLMGSSVRADGLGVGLSRGHVHITSAEFLGFWSPSLPHVGTRQPPYLWSDIGQPPPSQNRENLADVIYIQRF